MTALLLMLLLACAGGASDDAAKEESEKEEVVVDPRTLVEASSVVLGAVADRVIASAALTSEVSATVIPEASGVVTRLYVEEGDAVVRGQLLAELASPSLDGVWQRASAEVDRTAQDLAVAERLHAANALSLSELDVARRAAEAAKLSLAEAGRTRGFTRLKAPVAGTIATRNLRFGEVAGPSPAFVIMDLSRLQVVVDLPERELSRIKPDQEVTLTSAWSAEEAAKGRVLRVSPVVDPASGTFKVTVAVAPEQTVLRPGQYTNVAIEVDRRASVLTVPIRAVVWEEGAPYLYKVVEDTGEAEPGDEPEAAAKEPSWWEKLAAMQTEEEKPPELPGPKRKVARSAVELGYRDTEAFEVRSGVNEGDLVVTVGNLALRDGAKVRLPGDPALKEAVDQKPATPL